MVLTPAPAVPLPRELLDAVGLLLPNEHEAAAITGLTTPEEALEALLELVQEVVVTIGADGAIYGSRDGSRLRVPGRKVDAIDTTAAGDTFAGAFAVARGRRAVPPGSAWSSPPRPPRCRSSGPARRPPCLQERKSTPK